MTGSRTQLAADLVAQAKLPSAEQGEAQGTTWEPVNLRELVEGGARPVEPTLGFRTDAVGLLYPGKVHLMAGEPESGKSWLALVFAAQVMDERRRVLFLDFEDNALGILGRLRDMSVRLPDIYERFLYVRPQQPLTWQAQQLLAPLVADCSLVVIDGVTEMMEMHSLNPNTDLDVATMWDKLPRWAARLGPAVLMLDHVVKNTSARGRFATGSQHKLAAIDGAGYVLECGQPFGKGMAGTSQLYIAKDRHGGVRAHAAAGRNGMQHIGTLRIDATEEFVCASIEPPEATPSSGGTAGKWKPSDAMEEISRLLAATELKRQ